MLCSGNRLLYLQPPLAIASNPRRERNIVVESGGDRIGHSHQLEHCHRVAASHQRAGQGHDRKVASEALQAGRAARPADAIEDDVAEPGGGQEALLVEDREDDAMIGGVTPVRRESATESSAEEIGYMVAVGVSDEDEPAMRGNTQSYCGRYL